MNRKRKPNPKMQRLLEQAQRETAERTAKLDDTDDLLRLHKAMHPDIDAIRRQMQLDRGRAIMREDDENVMFTPVPGETIDQDENALVLHIRFDQGEDILETRVYQTIPFADLKEPPFQIKFLAKTRPDGLVWFLAKFIRPDGTTFLGLNPKRWLPEQEFRDMIDKTLAPLRTISVVSEPTVVTQAEYHQKGMFSS